LSTFRHDSSVNLTENGVDFTNSLYFRDLVKGGKVVISKGTSVNYHIRLQDAGNVTYMSQNSIAEAFTYSTWLLSKNSPFQSKTYSFLSSVTEFGLISKITADWTCTTIECQILKQKDPKAPALSIFHMDLCFYIWFCGCVLSFVVFLGEILIAKQLLNIIKNKDC